MPDYDESDDIYVTGYNFVDTTLGDDSDKKLAQAKNATRQAWCEVSVLASGTGQRRHGLVTFNCIFVREPHLSTGCGTVKNNTHKIWHDPVGNAGVYAWQRDTRGRYTGAFVWTRVEIYPVDPTNLATPPDTITTQHFFTFSGVATKNIGPANSTKAATTTPKTPGI